MGIGFKNIKNKKVRYEREEIKNKNKISNNKRKEKKKKRKERKRDERERIWWALSCDLAVFLTYNFSLFPSHSHISKIPRKNPFPLLHSPHSTFSLLLLLNPKLSLSLSLSLSLFQTFFQIPFFRSQTWKNHISAREPVRDISRRK